MYDLYRQMGCLEIIGYRLLDEFNKYINAKDNRNICRTFFETIKKNYNWTAYF